jgi:divalent metal cation (Fe/Co/Zn/Cd) transporter
MQRLGRRTTNIHRSLIQGASLAAGTHTSGAQLLLNPQTLGRRLYGSLGRTTSLLRNKCGHDHSHFGGHGHSHGHHHFDAAAFALDPSRSTSAEHADFCRRVTLAGAGTNLFFAIWKIFLGTQTGSSVALTADGMHMAVDLTSDMVSFTAVSLARHWPLKRKCRFPFGTGRIETLASLIIALILTTGAVNILYRSLKVIFGPSLAELWLLLTTGAVSEMAEHHAHDSHDGDHGHSHADADHGHCHEGPTSTSKSTVPVLSCGCSEPGHSHFDIRPLLEQDEKDRPATWVMVQMVAAATLCIVSKELLYRVGRRVGEQAGSAVVVANAYHHRVDAWSSAMALVGVVGSIFGVTWIDGVAAIAVSTGVLQIGCGLMSNALKELLSYQSAEFEWRSAKVDRNVAVQLGSDSGKSGSSGKLGNRPPSTVVSVVNVGVLRHGHTIHVTGKLLAPSAATASEIFTAAAVLKERFQAEFRCCSPNVEFMYDIVTPQMASTAALTTQATDAARSGSTESTTPAAATATASSTEKEKSQDASPTVAESGKGPAKQLQPQADKGNAEKDLVRLVAEFHGVNIRQAEFTMRLPPSASFQNKKVVASPRDDCCGDPTCAGPKFSNCERDFDALKVFLRPQLYDGN